MALPPLYGGPWLDLLVKDPLNYLRHSLRGNRADDADFALATPEKPPVLLIHGFMGTRGALFFLESRLRNDGFHVFSVNLGTLNVQDIRKSAFGIHLAVEKIRQATGGKVTKIDVVGHSMGGLIAAYYAKYMGGDAHLRKLIALGTPFRGTWAALMGVVAMGALAPSTWQMLPGSSFLRSLNRIPMPGSVEWTSVMARYDILCPPETARISPGNNYDLPLGHAGLVLSADVYRVIKRVLRREHQPATRTLFFQLDQGRWARTALNGDWSGAERRKGDRRRARRPQLRVIQGGQRRVAGGGRRKR